ncbi:MAG: phosphoglucosamine mutase, partial [Rhodococcus sp.]|nr:phosphoglucosamine mutase [Rhodococcus sp. (in: high G+C Gram-positive bacteria)]
MARLFGTDGVRGLAGGVLTAELAMTIARAAAAVLAPDVDGGRRTAVVGRDPRISGSMLGAAVSAGLTASGVDVIDVGVLPTPAVAYLTGEYGAALGVMISASHNAMPDNGIKIFAAGGHKLDDDMEDRIEALLGVDGRTEKPVDVTGAAIGRIDVAPDAAELYAAHLVAPLSHRLDGVTVVVDCSHGAASTVGPEIYRRAGATVVAINAEPNGLNINDGCGSTHLEGLQKAVVQHGADLGIAHDGDADRCLAVDASGAVVDGDAIMAVLAIAM